MEATRVSNGHDLEVGIADVYHIQNLEVRTPAHHNPPPAWLVKWEDTRPRLAIECFAEALGVGIYCYLGMGSATAFYISSAAKESGFGDLLTIGLAYGLGIILAIVCAGPASGGHLNPGFTISFWLFKGFPGRKVPYYIVSQIFGAYIGTLTVYGIYKAELDAVASALTAAGEASVIFSPLGPAGTLALYPGVGQALSNAFLNEFIANLFISIVVFSVLDPSNIFITYSVAPVLIAMSYMGCIWSFAINSLGLNTARDLGARLAVATVFAGGRTGAFPPGYTAITALTNLLAIPIGGAIQTFLLSDTARPIISAAPDGPSLRVLTRDAGSASLRSPSRDEKSL